MTVILFTIILVFVLRMTLSGVCLVVCSTFRRERVWSENLQIGIFPHLEDCISAIDRKLPLHAISETNKQFHYNGLKKQSDVCSWLKWLRNGDKCYNQIHYYFTMKIQSYNLQKGFGKSNCDFLTLVWPSCHSYMDILSHSYYIYVKWQ